MTTKSNNTVKKCLIGVVNDFNEFFILNPELNQNEYVLVSGTESLRNCINNNIKFSEINPLYDAGIKTGYLTLKYLCKDNLIK